MIYDEREAVRSARGFVMEMEIKRTRKDEEIICRLWRARSANSSSRLSEMEDEEDRKMNKGINNPKKTM